MTKNIFLIVFFISWIQIFSQTCENYERRLFHWLPDNFPEKINCKDKLGRKQGWWIYYKVQYNPVDKPDELAKGDFVRDYEFGQYKNDLKIGDWKTVENVHQIWVSKEENFVYKADTVIYTSDQIPYKETTFYINDSTIIKSEFVFHDSIPKTACIECNKKKYKPENSCALIYRGKLIKRFPYKDFSLENGKITFMYEREKKQIDNRLDK